MAYKTQRVASLCESCPFVKNAGRVESGMEFEGARGEHGKRHNVPKFSPIGTIPLLALLMFSGAFIRSKIFRKSRTLYAVEDSHLLVSKAKSMFSFESVQYNEN
jgi:hypothetical protein